MYCLKRFCRISFSDNWITQYYNCLQFSLFFIFFFLGSAYTYCSTVKINIYFLAGSIIQYVKKHL